MLDFKDYKKEDGKTDWDALRRDEIEKGHVCYRCRRFLMLFSRNVTGYRTLCNLCLALSEDKGRVQHENYVRCPKCRHTWSPYDHEMYGLLHDGDHEAHCPECGHSFGVTTHVSYTLCSPALLPDELEEDPQDEEEEAREGGEESPERKA